MHTLREGNADDLPFLRLMLMQAYHWNHAGPLPPQDEFLSQPHIRERLEDWRPNDGDRAVIAEQNSQPIGAAWYRFYTDDHHAYGYLNPQTPELGIGVLKNHRSQGIGRALLIELITLARSENLPALSLSVDPDNYAHNLYQSLGFTPVALEDTSLTMILKL